MQEAEHCDELLLMREGRLFAVASPAELLERTGQPTVKDAFLTIIEAQEEP